jgi:O-acetyl-ADP-ribose deacetylase (regulator of RNase III)|tara:strand:+ start:574 stop:732 length:159 start_codon:yes stop_codon:yes gene_type:complete
MALHIEAPDAKSIAFVSMGTGIYKLPMGLAADIVLKALLTSTFDETLMCLMD